MPTPLPPPYPPPVPPVPSGRRSAVRRYLHPVPDLPRRLAEYEGETPIRRCGCGRVIGDGDWAHGHRRCAMCRSLSGRRRPPGGPWLIPPPRDPGRG